MNDSTDQLDDLLKRVREDLDKTGFASELRAAQTCLKREWVVDAGLSFFDRDEQITREYDLRTNTTRRLMDGDQVLAWMYLYLAVELKKSAGPWVVFKRPVHDKFPVYGGWGQLIDAINLPVGKFHLTRKLEAISPVSSLGWRGYGVHEAFKSPSKPSRWWAAAVSSAKAAESVVETQRMDLNRKPQQPAENLYHERCEIQLVKPVVVLDGILLSAEMIGETMQVERCEMASLRFRFRTAAYGHRFAYHIDLVTLSAWEKYLAGLDRGFDEFMSEVGRRAGMDDRVRLDRTALEY